jgi:hypothetical protein
MNDYLALFVFFALAALAFGHYNRDKMAKPLLKGASA